jgi:predicted glycosyl hydrolase (DUF1957 family)
MHTSDCSSLPNRPMVVDTRVRIMRSIYPDRFDYREVHGSATCHRFQAEHHFGIKENAIGSW